MRVSDVKREYQLQEWSGMLRECKESGLTVKNWCAERGITEHAYYYRLRKLRRAACDALQQTQPVQLAEIPLDGFKITPLFVFLGYFFLYFSAFIV